MPFFSNYTLWFVDWFRFTATYVIYVYDSSKQDFNQNKQEDFEQLVTFSNKAHFSYHYLISYDHIHNVIVFVYNCIQFCTFLFLWILLFIFQYQKYSIQWRVDKKGTMSLFLKKEHCGNKCAIVDKLSTLVYWFTTVDDRELVATMSLTNPPNVDNLCPLIRPLLIHNL